ncbi:MAG TPA: ScpA family protein [Parvularculaceae bacterium]|nr:segregation/condensation protein A [Caulobacterales bacterium]HPE30689.1 ScpA family protein [Parvularculaceae bacterium]
MTESVALIEAAADATGNGAPETGAADSASDSDAPESSETEASSNGDGGDDFDAPVRSAPEGDEQIEQLVIDIDGYEGPLDVLLELARTQKVDLRKISMLALVEQYLAFVEAAKARNLELAADYLVMASWLAYLKSKLLLPVQEEAGEEPTADEMAARLAFQLQRLEAMRKSAESLLDLPQLGINVFPRGMPEGVRVKRTASWQASLYDLLHAYTRQRVAAVDRVYKIEQPKVFSIEEARQRLERILGAIPDWIDFRSLMQARDIDAPEQSVIASAFNATLEFAKAGKLEIRQMAPFAPIYVKSRNAEGEKREAE